MNNKAVHGLESVQFAFFLSNPGEKDLDVDSLFTAAFSRKASTIERAGVGTQAATSSDDGRVIRLGLSPMRLDVFISAVPVMPAQSFTPAQGDANNFIDALKHAVKAIAPLLPPVNRLGLVANWLEPASSQAAAIDMIEGDSGFRFAGPQDASTQDLTLSFNRPFASSVQMGRTFNQVMAWQIQRQQQVMFDASGLRIKEDLAVRSSIDINSSVALVVVNSEETSLPQQVLIEMSAEMFDRVSSTLRLG